MAAWSAGSRPTGSTRPAEHPEPLSAAEHRQRAAGQIYNFELTRPEQSLTSWQPVVRIDYQPIDGAARARSSTPAWGQPDEPILGSLPGFNDTQMNDPVVPLWSATVNYTINSTTFLEVTVGHASHRQAGCGLNGNGVEFLHRRFPGEPRRRTGPPTGWPACPCLFPDANVVDPELLPVRGAERSRSGELRRDAGPPAAGVSVGRPGREREYAAEQRLPGLRRLLGGQRLRGQPDQGARAATPSRPATTSRTRPSGRTRATRSAR